MIDLVFSNRTSGTTFGRSFFIRVLKIAAETLKLKGTVEVSVNLVTPSAMKALNKQHRGVDAVTDVLSFPLKEPRNAKYDILPIGDIFICPSYVRQFAAREGFVLSERMKHLTVHGFLHLVGYDHETSERDARTMERMENKILMRVS